MRVVKGIFNIIRWIIVFLVALFAISTLMNKAYGQTIIWLLIAFLFVFRPKMVGNKQGKTISFLLRSGVILILVAANVILMGSKPKTSIYISQEHQENLYRIYNQKLNGWPAGTENIWVLTKYGRVHVLACGEKANPPMIMLHAASMGAHSWAENLEPLLDQYRIYAIDNPGEGNKSELMKATVFPNNSEEIADLYATIADSLGIKSADVFGASNGGFIAMSFACHYPERVKSLALFGPMGLTPLSGKSIFMLSVSTLYPFQFVRNWVARWALGNDSYVNEKYGDWFNAIMRGTIPSVAMPVPLTVEEKRNIKMPVLLFLGTNDPIVGDAEKARKVANEFPNIKVEILESGHLLAVEKADYINRRIRDFLMLTEEK